MCSDCRSHYRVIYARRSGVCGVPGRTALGRGWFNFVVAVLVYTLYSAAILLSVPSLLMVFAAHWIEGKR